MATRSPNIDQPSLAANPAASPSTDAETLLRALRNVVILLVRPANRFGYSPDANEMALGLDGEQFVIALQKFMSSFLRSQRGPAGGIQIDVQEIVSDEYEDSSESESIPEGEPPAGSPSHSNHSPTTSVPNWDTESLFDRVALDSEMSQDPEGVELIDERPMGLVLNSPQGDEIINRDSADIRDTFEGQEARLLGKLQKALREQVFNIMPIRLLCFNPLTSDKLQVTLIERSEIYAHIASQIETNINISDLSHEILEWQAYDGFSEQDAERRTIKGIVEEYSGYAILSHTWLRGSSGEVTYGNWIRDDFDTQQPGYQKLVNFCKAARASYEVTFGWMDTICINKESSAELDESIRSMYKWYHNAHVCITYLADTVTLSGMHNDSWFTRGWTLQELLAPSRTKFYNTHWNELGNFRKGDWMDSIVVKQIEQATTITHSELMGRDQLSISRRMQMAAKRQVTREEDSAYSLMGLFNVSIATAYGEGAERAFCRLLQEILNSSRGGVIDMFNWAGPYSSHISSLFPDTPQGYLHRSSNKELHIVQKPIEPLLLTHLGLRITIILMPAISIQNPTSRYDSIGDYRAIADISALVPYLFPKDTMIGNSCSVLDARVSDSDGWNVGQKWYQCTFGILNITGEDDQNILVPKCCLAVTLRYASGSPYRIPSKAPIVFTLDKRHSSDGSDPPKYGYWHSEYYYSMVRSELASHGMKLVTMHL